MVCTPAAARLESLLNLHMLGAQPSKASSPNKVTPANVRAAAGLPSSAVQPPEGQAAPTIHNTGGNDPYINNSLQQGTHRLLTVNRTQ